MNDELGIKFSGKRNSFFSKIKKLLLQLFRLTDEPVVKVYHGYGNTDKIVLFGHVLRLSPLARKKYKKNFWTNSFALIRSYDFACCECACCIAME